jgi:hypothetical protein
MWRKNRRALPTTAQGWADALTNLGVPNPPFQNVNVPPPVAPNLARYTVPVYGAGPATDTIDIPAGTPIGVDLNRNCSTPAWGSHCPPDATSGIPAEEDYFGPRASSERETRNIEAQLAASAAAPPAGSLTSIDYHSYGQYILYPTEAWNNGVVGPAYIALGQIMQQLIRPAAAPWWGFDYKLGTPMQCLGYDAVGTLADRCAISHNARAYVVELDPTSRSIGFQLPENQIQTVFEKNIRGALALIVAAGRGSTVQNSSTWSLLNRRTIASSESQFMSWDVYGRGNRLPI